MSKYNTLPDLDNFDTNEDTNMFDTPSSSQGMDYTIDMDAVSGNMDNGKPSSSSNNNSSTMGKMTGMGNNKQTIQDTLDEPVLDTLVNIIIKTTITKKKILTYNFFFFSFLDESLFINNKLFIHLFT